MEDRLGAVRGRLVITTSPGNGTLIVGVVPISAAVPVPSLAGDRDP